MASTVIRVKRRITDEPFDRFVLNCKRLKTDHNEQKNEANNEAAISADSTKTIVKLTATVSTDDDIKTHLTRLRKVDAKEIVQKTRKPNRDITKLREQFKDEAQNHRFKVVNCFRSIEDEAESAEAISKQDITVVDVIKEDLKSIETQANEENTAAASNSSENDSKFVYDLYVVQCGEQPTEIDVNNYTIHPFDDLIYQMNDERLNDSDHDSDDSNDEANRRNEYPDTDDGFSVGEDDMRRAVEDLNFGSDADNLSSDDDDGNYGDDPVIHFMDESDDNDNEYEYFKKHGHRRNHATYYRSNQPNRRNILATENDSDMDEYSASNSPASSISPFASCDEDSDD